MTESVNWEILSYCASYLGHERAIFERFCNPPHPFVCWRSLFREGDNEVWHKTSENVLLGNDAKIYSAKRLSDGEVFVVGDDFLDSTGEIYSILGFSIYDKKTLLAECSMGVGKELKTWFDLEKLPRMPKGHQPKDERIDIDNFKREEIIQAFKDCYIEQYGKLDGRAYFVAGFIEAEVFTKAINNRLRSKEAKEFIRQSKPMTEQDIFCPPQKGEIKHI